MSTIVLLTAAQAAQVRGPSTIDPTTAALDPTPLSDGRFFLYVDVLSDPAHADKLSILSTLPTADYSTVQSLLPSPK